MTSQTRVQTITINISPNILRSKDNQIMNFYHLVECNMRNIFLEKSNTKCAGKPVVDPCIKKSKLSISFDQQSEMLYSLFLLYM